MENKDSNVLFQFDFFVFKYQVMIAVLKSFTIIPLFKKVGGIYDDSPESKGFVCGNSLLYRFLCFSGFVIDHSTNSESYKEFLKGNY